MTLIAFVALGLFSFVLLFSACNPFHGLQSLKPCILGAIQSRLGAAIGWKVLAQRRTCLALRGTKK